ncbi:MAG: glucosamine-6-phosphate deaminase [Clostridiales bacterium]|nr:glucosamine-6-phosphate deaminase [Clostridiales bacterium]HBM81585.1 glucosamine-6-phosphate deaminase [Clostridiaceae bacterium]
MKFIIAKDYDELSSIGAKIIKDQLNDKRDSVLGLATGSTPIGMYRKLVEEYDKGLDFSNIKTFNLDEYYGLPPVHPQSYRYFMDVNLFSHINIDKKNIHIPDGLCKNVEIECKNYDKAIENAGGIDLQVLGIGRNGHIGFNEPGSALMVGTHMTKLTEDTIRANSRFFDSYDDVPRFAITMGLGTIMKSRKIILLSSGPDKAPIMAKLIKPVVNTKVPASMLYLHNNVIVIMDTEAASYINPDELKSIAV